jgi:hypothetical protein
MPDLFGRRKLEFNKQIVTVALDRVGNESTAIDRKHRPPGCDVELPVMPRALYNPPLEGILKGTRRRRDHCALQSSATDWPPHVRTEVADCVELATDVVNTNLDVTHPDEQTVAERDLGGASDARYYALPIAHGN